MSTVNAVLVDGFAVDLSSSTGHSWQADEPVGVGGKGLDVKRVEVAYDHDRVHAKDCADCEDHQKGYIDRISSRVTIHGDLDTAQQQRLAEVAASCPVHKTLEKGVNLVDEVSFA